MGGLLASNDGGKIKWPVNSRVAAGLITSAARPATARREQKGLGWCPRDDVPAVNTQ